MWSISLLLYNLRRSVLMWLWVKASQWVESPVCALVNEPCNWWLWTVQHISSCKLTDKLEYGGWKKLTIRVISISATKSGHHSHRLSIEHTKEELVLLLPGKKRSKAKSSGGGATAESAEKSELNEAQPSSSSVKRSDKKKESGDSGRLTISHKSKLNQ